MVSLQWTKKSLFLWWASTSWSVFLKFCDSYWSSELNMNCRRKLLSSFLNKHKFQWFIPACPCTRWPTQIWAGSWRARRSRKHSVHQCKFCSLWEFSFTWSTVMIFHFRSVFLNPDYFGVLSNSFSYRVWIWHGKSTLLTLHYVVITARRLIAECWRRILWRTWGLCLNWTPMPRQQDVMPSSSMTLR